MASIFEVIYDLRLWIDCSITMPANKSPPPSEAVFCNVHKMDTSIVIFFKL